MEDGILDGGFGQRIASYLGRKNVRVFNYGFRRDFYDRRNVEELLKENHLTPELVWEDIKKGE
ncbi:MAG: hypothetical protein ILP17_06835 [Lachnospiraceae bacterium]|nr:hypothetical protein [Lachnospiraceae bacterium]